MAFFYICPHCGKHFDTPGVCPICHAALLPRQEQTASYSQRYCTRCGSPIEMPGQLFCTSCGAPLASPAVQGTQPIPIKQKKMPTWGIVLIGLGCVILFIFAILVFVINFGTLSSEGYRDPNDPWSGGNGGYSEFQDGEDNLVHTNAKLLIVSLTYSTGEELGFVYSDKDFAEVGLNIINTQDRSVSFDWSNFYLTEDVTGEKIYPYSDTDGIGYYVEISANEAVSGSLYFEIDPNSSYHLNFVESDGTLISSFALSKE